MLAGSTDTRAAPRQCEEFKAWNTKFQTDPMTQQYLNTYCKPCPTKKDVDVWKAKLKTQGITVVSILTEIYLPMARLFLSRN
jgi:hypothetical protein